MGKKRARSFLDSIQEFALVDAVSITAVRGQPPKTRKKILDCLKKTKLDKLHALSGEKFGRWLDRKTKEVQKCLGCRRIRWGMARKAMNLFLRNCYYFHDLRTHYRLEKIGPWLEVPLDSVVAGELIGKFPRELPEWVGLTYLQKADSEKYQKCAEKIATKISLPAKVYLDNILWVAGRNKR